MKHLILVAASLVLSVVPAFSQDLKPELKSEDVVISNVFKAPQVVTFDTTAINAKAAKAVDLDDISNVVAAKEIKRLARVEANRKMDLEYKAIPNKPNIFPHPFIKGQRIPHPFKRTDLWADYHQDTMRKYRTRGLPIGQGIATAIGMGFSIGAALK